MAADSALQRALRLAPVPAQHRAGGGLGALAQVPAARAVERLWRKIGPVEVTLRELHVFLAPARLLRGIAGEGQRIRVPAVLIEHLLDLRRDRLGEQRAEKELAIRSHAVADIIETDPVIEASA